MLRRLEWMCWVARRCLYMLLGSSNDPEVLHLLSRNLTLRDFRSHTLRRNQNFDTIVRRAGYPFEKVLVSTADGYQLELHRLPKPDSHRVMFLQHGIMDSSYSFIAKGASDGLAFRAFDKGSARAPPPLACAPRLMVQGESWFGSGLCPRWSVLERACSVRLRQCLVPSS